MVDANLSSEHSQERRGVYPRLVLFKFLDELVYMLGEVVQYKNYDATHRFNPDAADWVANHRHLFPIDSRPLRGADVIGTIKIGRGTTTVPDSEVLNSIKVGGETFADPDIPIRMG